jgi:BMFP domain-containing protein YqiC
MKIPLQEKIAELESRITALELRATAVETKLCGRTSRTIVTNDPNWHGFNADVEKHWRGLWREFDALMKSVFKGKP